jgi:hypothetical protein
MTGNRAALTLLVLAVLGPAIAIGMTRAVGNSFAGDSWAHGKLVELWAVSVVWVVACCIGAYTQWRRSS